MIRIVVCCLLLLGAVRLPCFGAEETASAGSRLDRETALLSAKLLLSQLQDTVSGQAADANAFYETMKQDPAKFVFLKTAREQLLQQHNTALQKAYRDEVDALLASISASQPAGSAALFDPAFVDQAKVLPPEAVQKNVEQQFEPAFQQARQRLVEEQRAGLVSMVFPSESEVDQYKQADLVKLMEQRLLEAAGKNILEENRPFVRDTLVTPLVEDALAQRQWQKDFINGAASSEPTTVNEFRTYLEKALAAAVEERREAEPNRKFYQLFPSLLPGVTSRAQALTLDKFFKHLTEYVLPLQLEDVKEAMQFAPDNFKTDESSRQTLYQRFRSRTLENAINRYCSLLSGAPHAELVHFLEATVPTAPAADEILNQYYDANIQPAVRDLRKQIIADQFKLFFPNLHNNTFRPTEQQLLEFRREGPEATLYNLNAFDLGNGMVDFKRLFDETIKQAQDQMLQLFTTADTALTTQDRLLEDSYNRLNQKVLELLPKQDPQQLGNAIQEILNVPSADRVSSSDRFTESFLYNAYVKMLESEWQKIRLATLWPDAATRPADAATRYHQLFDVVKQDIALRTQALLRDLRDPDAAREAANPNANQLTATYTIDVSGRDIVVSAGLMPSGAKRFFRCPVTRDYLKQEADTVSKAAVWLGNLLQDLPTDRESRLQVVIQVRNGRIYYQFIARLRNKIEEVMRKLDNPMLRLEIRDQLN